MNEEQEFYIWSWEHSAWWAPEAKGYVRSIENAGKYSYEGAVQICLGANYEFNHANKGKIMPMEGMVPILKS